MSDASEHKLLLIDTWRHGYTQSDNPIQHASLTDLW